ncbi:MAG TPA: XRE family transcriptional regulator [Aliiroseovarius sp.]|nr:XRE family transcriptional regulator [Aliiroseovarius sp.]
MDGSDLQGWYSEETATFGDRLAGAREAAGLSRKDLARRLGVKLKTLSAWEDDLAEPRANKLQMLAGLLNVSLSWLLTGQGEGVAAPDEAPGQAARAPDLQAALLEIRALRAEMLAGAERLGRLEKKLRGSVAGGGASDA